TLYPEMAENIAVFNTGSDEFSRDEFQNAHTLLLFKKTFVVASDDAQGSDIRMFSYGTSTGTSTLAKADITAVADKIKPHVRSVVTIGGAVLFILLVLVIGAALLGVNLVYVFFPA